MTQSEPTDLMPKIKINTHFNADQIFQTSSFGDDLVRHVINMKEQGVHDALIALGWTPPDRIPQKDNVSVCDISEALREMPKTIFNKDQGEEEVRTAKLIDWFFEHKKTVRKCLKATLSRPAESVVKQGWRTIDSAPEDGTIVLLAWPNKLKKLVYNNEHMPDWEMEVREYCIHGSGGSRSWHSQATHWMPLPPAPASDDGVK